MDITEFLKEEKLFVIFLWAIHFGEPPAMSLLLSKEDRDRERVNPSGNGLTHRTLPSNENPTRVPLAGMVT
ncbi:hypothetical protein E2562_007902 [Oryza meyeriana var. granulata]|uniref:Uncharacterized protein n=1 Tax=Oryza meyeriana var. granulata TaxID=110450 RepID=A0A6G1DVG7_9ORYZ|nr:hypothetical protein E2562_007902 [Oryza meyeriana var. granulata]